MKKQFSIFLFFLLFPTCVFAQHWPSMATSCYDPLVLKKDAQGTHLYVAGNFCELNGDSAKRGIAMWDGNNWFDLDSGISYNSTWPTVMDLEFYSNTLYAAGAFDHAGSIAANNIAVWNGTWWGNLGAGTNNTALDMCVFNGSLFVGGTFTMAGSTSANGLASWNGLTWSAVPNWTNETILAMEIYSGELYVATISGNILKFDGTNWQLLTTLISSSNFWVNCMKTVNNRLYVGGEFSGTSTLSSPNLIYYDGTNWNNSGISNYGTGWQYPAVNDLYNYNGTLLITGTFDSINNYFANGFGYFDGTNWQVLNGGPYTGNCLEVFQGDIYCGTRNELDIYDSTLVINEQNNFIAGTIYPNPVEDLIHIKFPGTRIVACEIYDGNGKSVKEFFNPGNDLFIGDLPPGIYFLKMKSEVTFYSMKFIRSE